MRNLILILSIPYTELKGYLQANCIAQLFLFDHFTEIDLNTIATGDQVR